MLIDNMKYRESLLRIARNYDIQKGTFIVSGATGLIGSCLIDSLLLSNRERNTQYDVYAIGRNEQKLYERFSYAGNRGIHYVVQDICKSIPENIDADFFVHTASTADPVSYAKYPVETLLTNIKGTRNILEYCQKHKKTKMLLTSTFEVYGKIDGVDIYEENMSGIIDQTRLRNIYPESKRAAELLLRAYAEEYGICGVIARLSSVYGPSMKMDDSKAHAQFIKNGLAGKDIVLKSAGTQKRSYTYVIDAVSGIMKILGCGNNTEVYNISNDNSVASIAEVAGVVAAISGTKVKYDIPNEIESIGFSTPQNCVLDNKKIKQLNWLPLFSLYDGLYDTIQILKMESNL